MTFHLWIPIREIVTHCPLRAEGEKIDLQLGVNPTLYWGEGEGGGHLVPLPKVLVSGAFQSDLRDPRCWHNSYMIMRIDFMKKKIKFF